jgi:hypothetical protein
MGYAGSRLRQSRGAKGGDVDVFSVQKLRVSLTKNGYMKLARLVRKYPRHEVLDHTYGSEPGIKLARSQAANILGADPETGQLPEFWDKIRDFDDKTIRCFTFASILLSHHKLIQAFSLAAQGNMHGHLRRDDLSEKEFTNVAYAMATLGLCDYERGSDGVTFDLYRLVYNLVPAHVLVRQLIESKLRRAGWLDPERFQFSNDGDFLSVCRRTQINQLFGLDSNQFEAWLNGRFEMEPPDDGRGDSMYLGGFSPRHPK